MTERTVWRRHEVESPGICAEDDCDGFGRVPERQRSIPWCKTHNSGFSIGAGWDEAAYVAMCDKVAWITDDEGKMCVEGRVWAVIENDRQESNDSMETINDR